MHFYKLGNKLFLTASRGNAVDESVLHNKFGFLEFLGQGLFCRLLDYSCSCESYGCSGSAIMISASIAKLAVTPPVVGSVRTAIYKSPASL